MINTFKIVISGGPGSGKTTIINSLKDKGYFCYDEVSRELIERNKKNIAHNIFIENPIKFSNMIWEKRENQYNKSIIQNKYEKVY